jgi:hypothetical protein
MMEKFSPPLHCCSSPLRNHHHQREKSEQAGRETWLKQDYLANPSGLKGTSLALLVCTGRQT